MVVNDAPSLPAAGGKSPRADHLPRFTASLIHCCCSFGRRVYSTPNGITHITPRDPDGEPDPTRPWVASPVDLQRDRPPGRHPRRASRLFPADWRPGALALPTGAQGGAGQGGPAGDGGRRDALQDLNKDGVSLAAAPLERAYLPLVDLRGANLVSADLQSANLRGANLQNANLRQANLQGANLRLSLQKALFVRVKKESANLQGANLQGANLGNSPFGALFTPAAKIGADLGRQQPPPGAN
jgi:Pentapeptide repeats (8 copies)